MHERYQHKAWAWLKEELTRRLGEDQVAAIWAEYARLGRIDRWQADVTRQRNTVRYYARAMESEPENARHRERHAAALGRLERAQAKVLAIAQQGAADA